MSFTTIRVETAASVATITLARPDKLNSFNETMHAELRDAFTTIEGDTNVRAVLLTGAGRGFCAGQALADVLPDGNNRADSAGDDDAGELADLLERNYNPLVRRLRALDRPVVAAVNGVAAGAGANIALACDIVIAARSAKFIQAFCKIGLVPASAGTYTLPRLVGPARAAGLAMLGDAIDAETAAQWGLIWKCVADDALMTDASGLARRLVQRRDVLPITSVAMEDQQAAKQNRRRTGTFLVIEIPIATSPENSSGGRVQAGGAVGPEMDIDTTRLDHR